MYENISDKNFVLTSIRTSRDVSCLSEMLYKVSPFSTVYNMSPFGYTPSSQKTLSTHLKGEITIFFKDETFITDLTSSSSLANKTDPTHCCSWTQRWYHMHENKKISDKLMSSTMYQVLLLLYSLMILEQTVLEILEEPEWVRPAIASTCLDQLQHNSFWTNCMYKRIYIYWYSDR